MIALNMENTDKYLLICYYETWIIYTCIALILRILTHSEVLTDLI